MRRICKRVRKRKLRSVSGKKVWVIVSDATEKSRRIEVRIKINILG